MRRRSMVLGAVLGGALLAACGSADTPSGTGPAAEGARVIEVVGASLAFEPERIEIAARSDVAIGLRANDIEHSLVIDEVGFSVAARSGQRRVGGLRIDVPGRYTAYCSVPGHRGAGMEMIVSVTP